MMDDLLQPGFLLVLRHAPDPAALRALEASVASLGAQLLCIDAATTAPNVLKLAEADGILAAWFERHGCEAALVRPDHLVYGVARTLEDAGVLMQRASRDIGIQPPTRPNPKTLTAQSAT
jgi:3-(3-hydroxy-phenyl)propionate hydroxylase